jgi:hypothetical protein
MFRCVGIWRDCNIGLADRDARRMTAPDVSRYVAIMSRGTTHDIRGTPRDPSEAVRAAASSAS